MVLLLRKYQKINYTSNANSRKVIILENFCIEDIYASYNGVKSEIKFFICPEYILQLFTIFLSKYNLGKILIIFIWIIKFYMRRKMWNLFLKLLEF